MERKATLIKAVWVSAISALLLAAAAYFIFAPGDVKFDGDRVRSTDPECFTLRFRAMNGDDAETLTLREGDELRVAWQIESGSVDVVIAMRGEGPLYRAEGRGEGDAADFHLTIPKSGEYTVTVSARKAKGSLAFRQERPGEN